MSGRDTETPNHEYSPERALEILTEMIDERDSMLADDIRRAIAAGIDDHTTEIALHASDEEPFELQRSTEGRKRLPERSRRPYSPEEALNVALDVLRVYFVDQPQIENSVIGRFAKSLAIGENLHDAHLPEIAIETTPNTDTPLEETSDTVLLRTVEKESIAEQEEQFEKLSKMFRFSGD